MSFWYFLFFIALIFDVRLEIAGIPVSFFLVVPVIFYTILKRPTNQLTPSIVITSTSILSLVLLVYVLFAVALSGLFSALAQLFVHLLLPICGVLVGSYFKGQEQKLKSMIWIFYIPFFFAVAQILNVYYDMAGPFAIFSKIKEWDYEIQGALNEDYVLASRAIGTFVNPNTLGYYFALLFWFLLLIFNRFNYHQLLCIVGVLLSGSRGSLVSLILSIIVVYLFKRKNNISSKRVIIVLFNLAMLIFAFLYYMSSAQSDSYEFLNRFSEIGSVFSGGSEKSTNLSGRMGAWDAISTYIDTHPWGTVLPPQTVLNESPDSQFFYFLAQGGWLLAFAYVLHMLVVFSWSFLSIQQRYLLLGASIIVAINGLSMATLNSGIVFLFYFILGHASSKELKRPE